MTPETQEWIRAHHNPIVAAQHREIAELERKLEEANHFRETCFLLLVGAYPREDDPPLIHDLHAALASR